VWLVVGLGNPGAHYAGNRHNVGFMVVAELMQRAGAPALRRKFGADVGEAQLGREKILFCKPMELMNRSGQAVSRVAQFWKIEPDSTVVVHDELDVPFGQLKLAVGGGAGGHNGIKSILADWGTPDFPRVRVGIGRPPAGHDAAGYVLQDFAKGDKAQVEILVAEAADAVEAIVASGLAAAMNKFNVKKKQNGVQ